MKDQIQLNNKKKNQKRKKGLQRQIKKANKKLKIKKFKKLNKELIFNYNAYKKQLFFKQQLNNLSFFLKEEQEMHENLMHLEHQKLLFIQQHKRFFEEQKYTKTWPCLGERYQLLSLLGKGGFSEVFKAYDLVEFREVACKIHQLNLNWSERSKANYIKHAIRESKIHSELKHPNIVQLYDTVEIDENSFATVLEYCEGPDLYFFLKKNKVLLIKIYNKQQKNYLKVIPEKEAKLLIKQILNALKYMNGQRNRIIHYDLKPQNIIFQKGELKITDFGLCKIFEDEQTKMELTSQGVGTYWYLPPETFEFDNNPQISHKVDIWSIGVIFYEMVFGQRPFGNNMSQDKILKVLNIFFQCIIFQNQENIILKSTQVQFPTKPNVSNECKQFIKNCLTYDQNFRWDIQQVCNCQYINKK
ncbi:protein kinase domain protein [Ichthyophthirius multifiliis]|uniref:Protein kinase domain protein n=1 Tax=Ichthyophthirius multifiliis TaxID=5932 RepID=G0QNQ4_ICHMU|nr:protein kinase domain protein [Ichthyophthirius multifiliis]EGR33155.1 protein kinase domain protein [Ichthyophthirius multifiliis]|eukprot:XP_004037141.1 protein kinase domain protein [Ichthyophthirius multifiliis]